MTDQLPESSRAIEMKEVECSSTSCKWRRVHYEKPLQPRGIQKFWVPEAAEGPFYCSIECSLYGPQELAQQAEDELKDQQQDSLGG